MSRVPLGTAAAIGEVDKATIRQWVYRGHINRYQDGDPNGEYESNEIHLWLEQIRKPGPVISAMHRQHQRMAS